MVCFCTDIFILVVLTVPCPNDFLFFLFICIIGKMRNGVWAKLAFS